jgi:hypothetical protein
MRMADLLQVHLPRVDGSGVAKYCPNGIANGDDVA